MGILTCRVAAFGFLLDEPFASRLSYELLFSFSAFL